MLSRISFHVLIRQDIQWVSLGSIDNLFMLCPSFLGVRVTTSSWGLDLLSSNQSEAIALADADQLIPGLILKRPSSHQMMQTTLPVWNGLDRVDRLFVYCVEL
nr:hypothetical protein [Tanacetum cinerariifolium]